MTVEELLQKLTELAMRGRGQWKVTMVDWDTFEYYDAEGIEVYDETQEIVIV